ncbi:uncharacterized protein LOC125068831 [Vanessa atalanta]|uniref:uncharacterized protein LOC125068831 n=1 Tax=Vanessa atalanta TaxID=42275 RepID=UPI001FCDA36E|nr:uncharacterized protein LOC125068831 [Vanessa atalanta]
MTKSTEENCRDKNENEEIISNGNLIKPDKNGDNMKDLNPLDFNSADDVRQTLKAVFTNKLPNFDENAEDYIGLKNDCDNDVVTNRNRKSPTLTIKTDDCKLNNNDKYLQTDKSKELPSSNEGKGKKRRGRPLKTEPSKKIKRQSISAMYIGKLSNLVFSKRDNESDSDFDSAIF